MSVKKKARRDIHYEVQAREGADWTTLELAEEEDSAVDLCERVWKSGRYKAVRVIREKFNPTTNIFETLELTYRGRKFSPSRFDEDNVAVCLAPADLYLAESRRMIGRLLNDILSKWQVTPSELLHCTKHYLRLEGTGSFLQAAVQRAAIAQNKDSGESVQERIKQIYSLIERAAKSLKGDWDSGLVPELEGRPLDAVIPATEQQGEHRTFLMTAILARELLLSEGYAAKVTRLLELLGKEHPDWVVRAADGILAECLSQGDVVFDLVGPGANMIDGLVAIARLARGDDEEAEQVDGDAPVLPTEATGAGQGEAAAAPSDAEKLRIFLARKRMPQVRRALLGVIARKLAGSDKLSGGVLDEELQALSTIHDVLDGAREELLGDITLLDAIEDRCSRFLNPQFVAEYLEAADGPENTLRALMALESHCYGMSNKRRIANFILPLLQSGENEVHFLRGGGNPVDRMRYLAKLQAAILSSGMSETHKQRMVERADELCTGIMERAKLLNKISAGGGNSLEAGKRLLAMLAGECFTVGRAKNAAMNELRLFLSQPEFAALLKGDPADPASAEARMLIQTLAEKAGVEF